MRVNIVIPAVNRNQFSGGVLCLLNYANGLAIRGHQVNVVAVMPSDSPDWFPKPWHFNFVSPVSDGLLSNAVKQIAAVIPAAIKLVATGQGIKHPLIKEKVFSASSDIVSYLMRWCRFGMKKGALIDNMIRCLPEADATIATDFETAYPIALAGKGAKFYFAQHFEPYFWKEKQGGIYSKVEAELSYRLGLRQMANSDWLAGMIQDNGGSQTVQVCPNAIDHSVFFGEPKRRESKHKLRIISYGGRDAEWKGFREMCEGMKKARQSRPEIEFEWMVYGSALLPPDNDIACYKFLGFLKPTQLADAYRNADVLLSASWYESFPLFPIEGMACGLFTICSQPGTEIYAMHEQTVHIVRSDPHEICSALVRAADDEEYRFNVAAQGNVKAKEFTWEKSVSRFEKIIAE